MKEIYYWYSVFKENHGYRWVVVNCVVDSKNVGIREEASGWVPFASLADYVANKYLRILYQSYAYNADGTAILYEE